MTWQMPSETAPHKRTWMAWPSGGYTLGDSLAEAEEARATWAQVAHATAEFEPVAMVVPPAEVPIAQRMLSREIEIHELELNDAWMRDIGPTFVLNEQGELGAVSWIFNGWGAQDWAQWNFDALAADFVAAQAGATLVESALVNEGGGINVDGLGTVLLTDTVQLDPGRNPGKTKAEVEAEFARTIGTTHAIWFKRGLTRDSQRFGTRGHVDIIATMPSDGVVLYHDQRNASHPDYEVSAELAATIAQQEDATGRALTAIPVPAPDALRDAEGYVDYSYINHLVVNDGVIACTFGDAVDDTALGILSDAYPGRTVVGVDARPLFARGGGIHCITQQEPQSRIHS